MTENVYRELQQHLDTLPIGYPETKSGVEIRILKHLFTPEEAKIAKMLKFSYEKQETLKEIYERVKDDLNISYEQLEESLSNMLRKGCLMGTEEGEKTYGNAMLVVGMFEFQVNKLTKEFIEDLHQYWKEGLLMEMGSTQISQMRIIPVEKSITPELGIATYEDIKTIIQNANGPFGLVNCVCSQGQALIGKPCKFTTQIERCLGWGDSLGPYLQLGWAREISKEEVFEVLRRNQEIGLVLQPGNAKRPDFVCSCCGCCCEGLQAIKMLPNPGEIVVSNYFAEVNSDECTGCGTCIDICQMEALTLIDNISTVDRKRCIGCGNCVPTCPSEALNLVKREKQLIPFETTIELYNAIGDRKTQIRETERKREERRARRLAKKPAN